MLNNEKLSKLIISLEELEKQRQNIIEKIEVKLIGIMGKIEPLKRGNWSFEEIDYNHDKDLFYVRFSHSCQGCGTDHWASFKVKEIDQFVDALQTDNPFEQFIIK